MPRAMHKQAQSYSLGQAHPYEPESEEDSNQAAPQESLSPGEVACLIHNVPEQPYSRPYPAKETDFEQDRPSQMRPHMPLELHGKAGGVLRELVFLRLC